MTLQLVRYRTGARIGGVSQSVDLTEYDVLPPALTTALESADHFEIDDVIDPADTRRWITTLLAAAPCAPTGTRKQIDTW